MDHYLRQTDPNQIHYYFQMDPSWRVLEERDKSESSEKYVKYPHPETLLIKIRIFLTKSFFLSKSISNFLFFFVGKTLNFGQEFLILSLRVRVRICGF